MTCKSTVLQLLAALGKRESSRNVPEGAAKALSMAQTANQCHGRQRQSRVSGRALCTEVQQVGKETEIWVLRTLTQNSTESSKNTLQALQRRGSIFQSY